MSLKNVLKFSCFVLAIFLLNANTGIAQKFKSDTYEFRDNLRINSKTKIAEIMYSTDKTIYKGTPEQIARQFLHENKTVFGIDNISDLQLLEVIESPGGKHVGFIQTYKGIPVYGSETVVSINDKNQVTTVANGCVPLKGFNNTSVNVGKEKALSNAKIKAKIIDDKQLIAEPKQKLYIYADSLYNLTLVWKVNITADSPVGSWDILIDVNTGDIVKFDDVRALVNGQGKVFIPDPVTYLNNTNLTDQNNTDYTAIQSAYSTVTLPNLSAADQNGWYWISGTYARSFQISAPNYPQVSNTTASFLLDRSQPGFEEVNAYYFIDAQRQYIGSLGFSPKWDGHDYIYFDAHGIEDDNSAYIPDYKWILFGDGGVDGAEDHNTIIHEYTHAVHDALMTGTGLGNGDEKTIGEGSADYMAVSYRRTLSSFQPDVCFPWDLNGMPDQRYLSSTVQYPDNWTDWYAGGTVWASTLMDIQNYGDIGRDVAHKLLLKSFSYANSSIIAPDHVFYVMRADQDIYGEAHLSSLGKGFYNRGFFNPRNNPTPAHPSNLLNGNITSSTTWNGIKWVNGYVYIKPGVYVRSYAFLFIGDNQRIVVENGATLEITGPLVKYFRADIQVNPGGNLIFSKRVGDNELTESELPSEYSLLGNYPNPFNPTTTIKYSLPKESSVELNIYDMLGRELKTYNVSSQQAGYNEITWDGRNENGESVSSGVYIYKIKFKTRGNYNTVEKSAKLVLTK
ncbi:MAG: T9SS type A sorting domain-containing protein [Ignavibacteriales bacterium]|nr:T9SS type A sorting domain-containing protein [Ignavibacteriales bacterium]